ncbi:hypothetical protein SAMN04489729_7051 [Amycolatopsis lurida]|uniref:Uncharacterized protein n=1 Tax=Amycolatopsis lurida NRRL 2430 TaxID=1460371 RepID=A0A2P2FG11_AMYLU|nr:hypothetical protein [Amycolatopsis lurida]KFU75667.1 hypothetical protein BB31_40345 [Amycolatopsis lurida NRRL 2430]SEE31271.1 hypothetical protein SAMN04489729_7051 [Amycolatopsis lurida]
MSLLKMPRLGRRKACASYRRVGEALLVHGPAGMTAGAGKLAASLQADTDYVLVVLDLPVGSSLRDWDAVADAVAEDERAVRLLPVKEACEITIVAAQWLADRIGRPVCYPDGVMLVGSSGLIFLPTKGSEGWTVCTPGQVAVRQGRRYPVPNWEAPANSSLLRVGRSATAEPLPAGLWIRSDGPESWLEAGRAKLTRWLSVSSQEVTVVLGAYGVPPLQPADVAQWWAALEPATRANVRFFCFGQVFEAAKVAPGQILADVLGEEVVCYGGLPVGRSDAPEVFTLRPDGSHGVRTFAEQLVFLPRRAPRSENDLFAPRIRRSRPPFESLTESEPGLYLHDSGAVVEVVQAGLWVRPPEVPAQATAIRATPPEAESLLVFHDPADERLVARVLDQLDDKARAVTKTVSVTTPVERSRTHLSSASDLTMPLTPLPRLSQLFRRGPGSVAAPTGEQDDPGLLGGQESHEEIAQDYDRTLATEKIRHPAAKPSGQRTESAPLAEQTEELDDHPLARSVMQQPPDPRHRVWPAPPGFSAELTMVRSGRESAFDALSERVGAVMRRFSPNRLAPESVLTAAVAAGLYLAGEDPDVDGGLRARTAGPHVDFGRCVADGLQKLPLHRKATASVVAPGPELWELLETGIVLLEWGFLHTRTVLGPVEIGSTDLVVWSLTGRQTTVIEPMEGGVADRVVFSPGTAFKVLEVIEPEGEKRGRILMRELADADTGKDEKSSGRDGLIRASLQRFADRAIRAVEPVPTGQASRFGRVPGVANAMILEGRR